MCAQASATGLPDQTSEGREAFDGHPPGTDALSETHGGVPCASAPSSWRIRRAIGLAAAVQRDYFKGNDATCAKFGTTLVTVIAGPLNYVGANPKIKRAETLKVNATRFGPSEQATAASRP